MILFIKYNGMIGHLETVDEYCYEQKFKKIDPSITGSVEIERWLKIIRANFYFSISVKWAQIKGNTYKLGAIVVTGSELTPSFAFFVQTVHA